MKMKNQWIVGLRLASVGVITALFHSCGVPAGAPMSNEAAPTPSVTAASGGLRSGDYSVTRDSVDAYLNKKSVSQNRPGIATGWGDEIKSSVSIGSFRRASSSPASIASIYYNDKEGIKAMTSSWRYNGKGLQKAANGLVEWGVKSSWGYLKNVHSGGKRFVVGTHGRTYSLVVKNVAHSKLEEVLSVDGLDVLDGKSASLKKRGYIIAPGKTLVVKGFRKSEDAVAAFKFSTVRDSYSSLSNQGTRNVGVMGMAVYTQKGVSPWRYGTHEIKSRTGARAFAEAPSVRAR